MALVFRGDIVTRGYVDNERYVLVKSISCLARSEVEKNIEDWVRMRELLRDGHRFISLSYLGEGLIGLIFEEPKKY